MTAYEKLSLGLETLVVLILIVEFWYDAWFNNREQRLKRRNNKKKSFDFMALTQGEGK